jgi:hypothetical protein
MQRIVIVDEAELGQLATLVARLTPAQQRLVTALADGFRGGWVEPFQWERAWRGSNMSDEVVVGDARTWLARRIHDGGRPHRGKDRPSRYRNAQPGAVTPASVSGV